MSPLNIAIVVAALLLVGLLLKMRHDRRTREDAEMDGTPAQWAAFTGGAPAAQGGPATVAVPAADDPSGGATGAWVVGAGDGAPAGGFVADPGWPLPAQGDWPGADVATAAGAPEPHAPGPPVWQGTQEPAATAGTQSGGASWSEPAPVSVSGHPVASTPAVADTAGEPMTRPDLPGPTVVAGAPARAGDLAADRPWGDGADALMPPAWPAVGADTPPGRAQGLSGANGSFGADTPAPANGVLAVNEAHPELALAEQAAVATGPDQRDFPAWTGPEADRAVEPEPAPNAAWWDLPLPSEPADASDATSGPTPAPRAVRGRFALGGHAVMPGQPAVSGVSFPRPPADVPRAWRLGPAADAPEGTLVLDLELDENCLPESLEVMQGHGVGPSTDGFVVRVVAEDMGPFMAAGTFRIVTGHGDQPA